MDVLLHCLSHFSFLQAASSPQQLMQQAAHYGYRCVAITDECSLSGIVQAYDAAQRYQLKLIVGAYFHLEDANFILLAPCAEAYRQLVGIISDARAQAAKGDYHFTLSLLPKKCRCLVLYDGENAQHLAQLQQQQQQCYVVMADDLSGNRHWPRRLTLSAQFALPCVAAERILMHSHEQLLLQDVLTATRQQCSLAQLGLRRQHNAAHVLPTLALRQQRYRKAWLQQAQQIADLCHFDLASLCYQYPEDSLPAGIDADVYLRQLVYQGAALYLPVPLSKQLTQQIEHELQLIKQLQYQHYFLTIYDIVQYARSRGILCQGRGSAANSIVCFCLAITAVNPTEVSLLFERFISIERQEPPDIDVDFEHQRREEVIQYIYQRYGRQRAALAASIVRYRKRSALRDIGRALDIPAVVLVWLNQQIDWRAPSASLKQQLIDSQQLSTEHIELLVLLMQQLCGTPRHLSQHVGGFVIAKHSLRDLVPTENAAMPQRTVIQWDKDDLQRLGLMKVDILALGMLSALQQCLGLIKQHYQQKLTLSTLPRQDAAVFAMLQQGDSMGVFQIESRAQMNMLPRLRPTNYYDLVVQIAIVRPGPIQGNMVHPYLQRRQGQQAITYPNPAIQSTLARTLGVPIFQEQVIQLAMVAAGFSAGQADALRRAMAKWKFAGDLQHFRQPFLHGMLQNGYSDEFANQLFAQIQGFGEYGFPESHAASFALLAYASAYLKYHFPAAFYCALLNCQPMGFYSPSQLLQDAKRHQVVILPIDINHSEWQHQLSQQQQHIALQLGLCAINGLQRAVLQSALTKRPAGGFSSLAQLRQYLDEASLQALASADALRSLQLERYQARWQLALQLPTTPLLAAQQGDEQQVCAAQPVHAMIEDYHSTGFSLHLHPLAYLRKQGQLAGFRHSLQLTACHNGQWVQCAGLVVCRQRPATANGVTFITLEDEFGQINVLLWPTTAHNQRNAWFNSQLLLVQGIVQQQQNVLHVVAGRLTDGQTQLETLPLHTRNFR